MGNKFGWHSGTLTCKDAKIQGDLYVQDDIVFSDVSAGALSVTGNIKFSDLVSGLTESAIQIGNYSSAIALGTISENYVINSLNVSAGIDDDSNIIGRYTKLATSAASNTGSSVFEACYSNITIAHDAKDAYGNRSYIDISGGTPTVNQIFSYFAQVNIGSATELESTGNIAGVYSYIDGTADVTLESGTVQGVHGVYVIWTASGITTADTYGVRVDVADTLDYAYAITGSGTLTSFLGVPHDTSDSVTNFLKTAGEGGFVGTTRGTPDKTAICDGSLKVLIGSKTLYIPLYNAITAS